jgi:hypothetical protein
LGQPITAGLAGQLQRTQPACGALLLLIRGAASHLHPVLDLLHAHRKAGFTATSAAAVMVSRRRVRCRVMQFDGIGPSVPLVLASTESPGVSRVAPEKRFESCGVCHAKELPAPQFLLDIIPMVSP